MYRKFERRRYYAINFNAEFTKATYLLLYNNETKNIQGLYRIAKDCYKIFSSDHMHKIGYPIANENQLYIVLEIVSDNIDKELIIHKQSVENLVIEGRSYIVEKYNKLLQTDRPRL